MVTAVNNMTLWETCNPGEAPPGAPRANYRTALDQAVAHIWGEQARYQAVAKTTGVPWYVIGCLHWLEGSGSFNKHLHNGDPLRAKTVNVPAGRPAADSWTWETSAEDALKWDKLAGRSDWTLETILERCERFNGLGYRKRGYPSPYLFGGSNVMVAGKFIRDGVWSDSAWSEQVGVATILKSMEVRGLIKIPRSVPANPVAVAVKAAAAGSGASGLVAQADTHTGLIVLVVTAIVVVGCIIYGLSRRVPS